MNRQTYLQELRERLKFRGASRQQVNDIVAEVDSHLTESGEDPVDTFGPPDRYAARLLRGRWHTARFLLALGAAAGAALLLTELVVTRNVGDTAVSVQGGDAAFLAVIFLAVAAVNLPVVHNRIPRLGARLLVAAILIGAASYVSSVVGNTAPGQRVLVTLPGPVAIAVGLALLASAVAIFGSPHLRRWWRSRATRSQRQRR